MCFLVYVIRNIDLETHLLPCSVPNQVLPKPVILPTSQEQADQSKTPMQEGVVLPFCLRLTVGKGMRVHMIECEKIVSFFVSLSGFPR